MELRGFGERDPLIGDSCSVYSADSYDPEFIQIGSCEDEVLHETSHVDFPKKYAVGTDYIDKYPRRRIKIT